MTNNIIDNKRIAKNTIFLYLRMLVVMGVGLYTVRAILDLLGVVDYGIYNVVGGVVAMFSFLNGTLSTASQRYFSIALAKADLKRLNEWFCLNISTFSIFIIFFILFAETIGLWFVNTQMTIPKERMVAANVVYQLSIVSFCVSFFSIPYNALIIAHERMSAFAYISIVEALLKLLIVFLLAIISWDKLIIYAVLMFLASCGITLAFIIYDRIHFCESKYRFYWNKKELADLLGFSGWHFFGTFSVVVRSQGINILINLFFNPSVNAARAIAYQVYGAVSQFSENFLIAVKPQIYKVYASSDFESLNKLVIRSTIMCSFLISVLIFPILANCSYILNLWLKEVPAYTIVFTQLVLINGLIDSTNGPITASVLASGKIRNYELVVATLFIFNLPISYVILKTGADPTSTMYVSIVLSLIISFARAFILSTKIRLPFLKYVYMFFKIFVGSLCAWIATYYTVYNSADSLLMFVIDSILIVFMLVVIYCVVVFDKEDVIFFANIVKSKLK